MSLTRILEKFDPSTRTCTHILYPRPHVLDIDIRGTWHFDPYLHPHPTPKSMWHPMWGCSFMAIYIYWKLKAVEIYAFKQDALLSCLNECGGPWQGLYMYDFRPIVGNCVALFNDRGLCHTFHTITIDCVSKIIAMNLNTVIIWNYCQHQQNFRWLVVHVVCICFPNLFVGIKNAMNENNFENKWWCTRWVTNRRNTAVVLFLEQSFYLSVSVFVSLHTALGKNIRPCFASEPLL